MGRQGMDIPGEIATVRRELICFRDVCLPAFFQPTGPLDHLDDLVRPLPRWRGAVDRLLDALDFSATGAAPAPTDRANDREFLSRRVTASSYFVRDGRIAWRIELFVAWDWGAEDVLYRPSSDWVPPADAVGELWRRLPESRRWILSQPVDEPFLWNLLCVGLVPIADVDPEFAKRVLDPETWRAIVLGDCGIDGETRARRLRVIDGYFHRVLNNALLHVMGALANNHFEVVPGLLDHPALLGGYTSLMPHYLLTVLAEKVRGLRDIAGECKPVS